MTVYYGNTNNISNNEYETFYQIQGGEGGGM